jgi:hypothetical protein
MQILSTDVLVVGGGTGGTAAALQAARRGANTILVSEFPWLGGMLTSAGVSAPDGNELVALQTGIWGEFLRELQHRTPNLHNGWVSFFTYDPRVGAEFFADRVAALPNLQWIAGQVPLEVQQQNGRLTAVRFGDFTIHAQVILDGTELGDLLALATVPHRWGWELQAEFDEPSAPIAPNDLIDRYPVQAPTWVVVMQDFGAGATAPEIPVPPNYQPERFRDAWKDYGATQFLNYGRLPGDRFMINWPIQGNDYGEGVQRLIESPVAQQEFLQASRWHSQSFAQFIQAQLGRRYGLADIFPQLPGCLGGGAYALHPYYRESRRVCGITTLREQDILPIAGGQVAALPLDATGTVDAIAVGNYANDHHYPGHKIDLQPKSMRWGGRWTGTPFTIPYRCLIPATIEGLLVCEKNISVSHIANGATRLQPVVLAIGQAAGMAAALCVEQQCQPRELAVRSLQNALLQDQTAPAAVIPLLDLTPSHPDWLGWQQLVLDHPDRYSITGEIADNLSQWQVVAINQSINSDAARNLNSLTVVGSKLKKLDQQSYQLQVLEPKHLCGQTFSLVTLHADVNQQLMAQTDPQVISIQCHVNHAGGWLLVESISLVSPASDG